MPHAIFIHGLESGNQGTKAVYFRERFPKLLTPQFDGALVERMEVLEDILEPLEHLTLVGSSFGGLMAALFAMLHPEKVCQLILLAPAIHLISASTYPVRPIPTPAILFHGIQDEVIPIDKVEPLSRELFQHLSFHLVEDDHFLHRTFRSIPWPLYLAPFRK
ncbi:alpha/beta fold hydrolase [Desulfatiglans anilini]|uniref:alpha/beta fold hydrolase n=1 Tax=Desulfatiglans anilini TaxID=90728 RepID=UPI0003FC3599|nr:alpha/beta fold hydrolase [Desulfatiglans anilini]